MVLKVDIPFDPLTGKVPEPERGDLGTATPVAPPTAVEQSRTFTDYLRDTRHGNPAVTANEAYLARRKAAENDLGDSTLMDKIMDLSSRAANDVRQGFETGEVTRGIGIGFAHAGLEIYRALGAEKVFEALSSATGSGKTFAEADASITAAKKGMETGTGAVAAEASPYIANAILAMTGVGTWVKALGYSRSAQALFMLGADKISDFVTGSMMENPQDANVMNLLRELAKAKQGSKFWGAIEPTAKFLAANPEDSAAMRRLKRGATEAMTNVFGDVALVAGKGIASGVRTAGQAMEPFLDWIKKARSDGTLQTTIDSLRAAADQAKHIENEMLEEGKSGLMLLHSGGQITDPRQIEHLVLKGAGKFADALEGFQRRIASNRGVLPIDPDVAAARVATLVKRNMAVRAGKPQPGDFKNERTVITPPADRPDLPTIVVGRGVTTDDWLNKIEHVLSPAEIDSAARWYEDIAAVFVNYVGERDAPLYMTAWLVANQHVDPAGAMMGTLRVAERLRSEIPLVQARAAEYSKKAGVTDDVLVELFMDKLSGKGYGVKIVDFVDSAFGRSKRSWFASDDIAGAPAVVDVHSYRDVGGVDSGLMNFIRKNYGDEQANKIVYDQMPDKKGKSGGASDTQYEVAANKLRDITAELNDRNWRGKSDWKASEVQAIGWATQAKMTGDFQTPDQALLSNIHRVSFELTPGAGSPFDVEFGARFSKLSEDAKVQVTRKVLDRAHAMARSISGVRTHIEVFGSGGWQQDPLQPARIQNLLATPEGAKTYANVIGYLLQQTEVWTNNVGKKGGNAMAIDIVEVGSRSLEDDMILRATWARIQAADTSGLIGGFQPFRREDGSVGIRVLVMGRGEKQVARLEGEVIEVIRSALSGGNVRYETDIKPAAVHIAKNNWKEHPDGRGYTQGLGEAGIVQGRDLDPNRSELKALFARELDIAERAGGGSGAGKGKGEGPAKSGVTEPPVGKPPAAGGS